MTKKEENIDIKDYQGDLINKVIIWQTLKIEEYMRMRIKDKPKLMPNWLYKKLLNMLVVVEYFK